MLLKRLGEGFLFLCCFPGRFIVGTKQSRSNERAPLKNWYLHEFDNTGQKKHARGADETSGRLEEQRVPLAGTPLPHH